LPKCEAVAFRREVPYVVGSTASDPFSRRTGRRDTSGIHGDTQSVRMHSGATNLLCDAPTRLVEWRLCGMIERLEDPLRPCASLKLVWRIDMAQTVG
jgi:hypothetical protein